MSIVTLFTRKSPTLAGFEFDAVLEDTFESEVQTAGYPIESGARAADHRIILPLRWRLVGAVSNNPLRTSVTDFTGVLSNFGGGIAAQVAGLSAGFLAGSNDTRASDALALLFAIQVSGEPFDIDAGDFQLSNMVIETISRTKDPSNENGLIFVAQLKEMPTLDTLLSANRQPQQGDLREGDPAQSQAAADVNLGEQGLSSTSTSTSSSVSGVLGL